VWLWLLSYMAVPTDLAVTTGLSEFAVDSPISPSWVLPGKAQDQPADIASGGRAT
jgi:hypothetical protein